MQEKTNTFLETEPLRRLMGRYAVPCVISLLVAALYNIVDQIFIANASYLGSYGNAANTVVFPLTVVAPAIAVLIGDGCCAFVSISLGAGKAGDAHRSIGTAVVLSVSVGVLLTAVYLIFANPISRMFGGSVNEETFRLSREYFFYISLGIPFYLFGQTLNPIIRSDGSPNFAMISTVSGAVVNILLDPLFIFGFRWGMMGAAVATVLGQVLTAALSIWYLCHMKAVKLEKDSFRPRGGLMAKFLPLGLCSLLSQLSLVAAMAAINNMLRRYRALDPVFSQEQYVQIPMAVGLAAGCIPVVGYNIGAGCKDRARKLFTYLLAAEAMVGAVALIIIECFPVQLIGIFGAKNESQYYTDFAVRSFRVYLCMMIFACVNKGTFIYLQSLGKAFASIALVLIIGTFRTLRMESPSGEANLRGQNAAAVQE